VNEDKLGFFFDGGARITSGTYKMMSPAAGLALSDGITYENDGVVFAAADATSADFIRGELATTIAKYGAAAPLAARGRAGVADFVYVAYGDASDGSQATSAYVYAGYFANSGVALAANANADAAAIATVKNGISIASLAEIVGVDPDTFASGNLTSNKPAGLS